MLLLRNIRATSDLEYLLRIAVFKVRHSSKFRFRNLHPESLAYLWIPHSFFHPHSPQSLFRISPQISAKICDSFCQVIMADLRHEGCIYLKDLAYSNPYPYGILDNNHLPSCNQISYHVILSMQFHNLITSILLLWTLTQWASRTPRWDLWLVIISLKIRFVKILLKPNS